MNFHPLETIANFMTDSWNKAWLLMIDLLRVLVVVLMALTMLGAIGLALIFVGLMIGSAFGVIDLKTDKTKSTSAAKAKAKADKPSPDSSLKKAIETSSSEQDSSPSAGFVHILDEKRRLEIEIEILEEVLRARREKLAQLT